MLTEVLLAPLVLLLFIAISPFIALVGIAWTVGATGQTIYYRDRAFHKIPGGGISANYREESTGVEFWISGPKKDGNDRLFRQRVPVEIDDDVRDEYWSKIRKQPDEKQRKTA